MAIEIMPDDSDDGDLILERFWPFLSPLVMIGG